MHFAIKLFLFSSILAVFFSCSKHEQPKRKKQFELMNGAQTGVNFSNDLPYTEAFNTYTYRNFYNGGGVALGDINNDGLLDIYFSGNITDNKLFLNLGNWKFKDITATAGVACPDVWSTGVNFVDINADGWMDIYVCKAGKPEGPNRHNELFINQKNNTFIEAAGAYGLDNLGMSIHTAFFDYDQDGDLDCYLLNNSIRSVGGFDLKKGLRDIHDPEGNKFLKNENGKFIDVTQEVGMYSSNIGYGLGITLADFNMDGWADIFISNDFFERDYLYLNNQDGTFSETATQSFESFSMGSMGADACDIDNDLIPDLFVTEMLPHTLERKKSKAMYDSWNKYTLEVNAGYHHQFSRNSLQRNLGNNQFMEIGRLAGVAASEWSWASLIQDLDNDGMRDLFISNGIYKDLLDKDYLNYFADDALIKAKIAKKEKVLTTLIDSMPSAAVSNFVYKNKGDFQFELAHDEWGLAEATFSNGSAYGDLDNDGDLDLVINNANMPAYLYQNNLDTINNRSIQFELIGDQKNTKAIGAKIVLKYGEKQSMYEQYTSKGFQSSIDTKVHFGVAKAKEIDSVLVYWPGGKTSTYYNLATNQLHTLRQSEGINNFTHKNAAKKNDVQFSTFDFKHEAARLNLFSRQGMLIEMAGFSGPAMTSADLNGDNRKDIFIGGGKNQSSALFLSVGENEYLKSTAGFEKKSSSEVVAAQFIDLDKDGDLDLYVGHGGSSYSNFSPELNDVIYLNDGKTNFSEAPNQIPFKSAVHTGAVAIDDLNNDGLPDIVVGEKMKNKQFGLPGSVFIFINKGNNIFEQLSTVVLENLGMISAIAIADLNKDGWNDILLAGKWMGLTVITNDNGNFNNVQSIESLKNTMGLWNEIFAVDLDRDGDQDFLLGNEGLNNFYKKGMRMFVHDFDQNGTGEQFVCEKIGGNYYPIHDIDEMFAQVPLLKKKFISYNSFAKASITEMFDEENISKALKFDLEEIRSGILLNNEGTLEYQPFPLEAQYSSIYAFESLQSNAGGQIFMGGNNYRVKPQFGKQDASQGWVLDYMINQQAIQFDGMQPLYIKGQIRSIENIASHLLFGINNDVVKLYEPVFN